MYDLDKAYNKKFFAQRESLAWRVPIVVEAITKVLNPKSVIDVGCGNGDLLDGLCSTLQRPCYGVEGTINALASITPSQQRYMFIRDIRYPFDDFLLNRVDLALCFEVAEHIENEYANILVDNLCSLSDTILMSAAKPGQKGRYHVNCQPWSYWFYKFADRGYRANHSVVTEIREHLEKWKNKKGIKAYYQNLMCWEVN